MIKERIKGVLVGCAYGDAMGMPTENMTREEILERYPYGIKEFYPSFNTGATGRNFVAGEVTDDTINTMILLECLIKNQGKPNAETYILELKHWMEAHSEQNEVIVGRSTRRALEAIEMGGDMSQTGFWGTTNGASMKISPIGIISNYQNMDQLVNNVYEICYPTHNNQIAIQGACIIAALVSYGIQGGSIEGIWDIALQALEAAEGKGYRMGGPKLRKRIEVIRHEMKNKSEESVLNLLSDLYGTGLETIETIPTVLALLQLSKGDPILLGQMAASLGGDTDTIGAIGCAVAGGMHPEFPEEIILKLESVNNINFDTLSARILPYILS